MSSVLPALVDAWVDLVAARLPRVTVAAQDLGEDSTSTAVYLTKYISDFRWACLGGDQDERIELRGFVKTYSSRTGQRDAARDARNRAFELLQAVQDAITSDSVTPHQLSGTVSWGLVARWEVEIASAEKGWIATGAFLIRATYFA